MPRKLIRLILAVVVAAPSGATSAGADPATAPGPARASTATPPDRAKSAAPAPLPGRPGPRPHDETPVEEVTPTRVLPARAPSVWSRASFSDPALEPRRERGVNLGLARTTRKHAFLITIDHRARQPFTDHAWRDFFGLDAGGLKIGLGLRFGILEGLDVGLYRLNGASEIFDTYEADLRWRFLHQERHQVDVALRAGASWFSQPGRRDAAGGFAQILATRTLWDRLTLSVGVLFHSESSGPAKSNHDEAWSLALAGLAEVRLAKFLAWNLEVYGAVAGYGARYPAFSSSLAFITHRHVFSLVLSSTQYLGADGLVAGTPNGFEDLVIGFSILRELGI